MRLAILPLLALSGCALEPAALDFEATHNSHLLQHDPFLSDWSRNQPGYDVLGVAAKWEPSRSTYIKIGEYYSPECLDGQHEVFQATFGYELRLK